MLELVILVEEPDRDAFMATVQDLLESVDLGGFSHRAIHDWTDDDSFAEWLRAKFGNVWAVTSSTEVARPGSTPDIPRARLVLEAGATPGKLP